MGGWNRYSLITLALTGLLLASLGCQTVASGYKYKGVTIDPAKPLPDFELMAANGQPFRLSQVAGDIALVYFGYTYCPDVCSLTMWEVKKTLIALDTGQERVRVIFISVDPERDRPEILAQYMAVFGPQFIGLTDDFDKVRAVMKPYGAHAEKEEVSDSATGYVVSHTGTIFLVDSQRRLILQYPFGFKAEDLASDLNYLLKQENF